MASQSHLRRLLFDILRVRPAASPPDWSSRRAQPASNSSLHTKTFVRCLRSGCTEPNPRKLGGFANHFSSSGKWSTTSFVATSQTTTSTYFWSIPRTARSTSSTRGLVPCSGLSLPAPRAELNASAWFRRGSCRVILSSGAPCHHGRSCCPARPRLPSVRRDRACSAGLKPWSFTASFLHFLRLFFLLPTVTISKGVLGSSPRTFFLLSFSRATSLPYDCPSVGGPIHASVLLSHQCSHLVAFAYALLQYRVFPTCQYGTAYAATCGHFLRTFAFGHSFFCSVTSETSIRQLFFS